MKHRVQYRRDGASEQCSYASTFRTTQQRDRIGLYCVRAPTSNLTVVSDLRHPLLLDILKGAWGDDAETDQENVRLKYSNFYLI